jgi:hypothetical protein
VPSAWSRSTSNAGFDEIRRGPRATTVADRGVLVCHLPYRGDIGDTERYRKFRPIHAGMWLLHGHVDQLAALVNGLGNLLDVLANAARKTRLRCTGSSGYGSRTTSATRRHRGVGPVGESQCRRPQVANLRPAMTSTSPPSGRASTWPAVAIPATEALFPAPNADSALGSAPSRSDHVSRRTTCSVRSDSGQPGHRSRLRLQALGRSGSAMRARRNDPGRGLARSRSTIRLRDACRESSQRWTPAAQ